MERVRKEIVDTLAIVPQDSMETLVIKVFLVYISQVVVYGFQGKSSFGCLRPSPMYEGLVYKLN